MAPFPILFIKLIRSSYGNFKNTKALSYSRNIIKQNTDVKIIQIIIIQTWTNRMVKAFGEPVSVSEAFLTVFIWFWAGYAKYKWKVQIEKVNPNSIIGRLWKEYRLKSYFTLLFFFSSSFLRSSGYLPLSWRPLKLPPRKMNVKVNDCLSVSGSKC